MTDTAHQRVGAAAESAAGRPSLQLFSVSALLLFLELACIRWFPAHVLFLTFFTNVILLATFLGMSVGCMAASSRSHWIVRTPVLLSLAMAAGLVVELSQDRLRSVIDVGQQRAPDVVFFGAESSSQTLPTFVLPIEILAGFFFVMVALAMVGPGQELGRALERIANPVRAYTINVLGSIFGIVAFSLCAWLELGPIWWFSLGAGALLPVLRQRVIGRRALAAASTVLAIPLLAGWSSLPGTIDGSVAIEHRWSPYYRLDYIGAPYRYISVNLIGHQVMAARDAGFSPQFFYNLPHLLRRDAGGEAFQDVLVIGAGSGNDVAAALSWGADHVDAVEIDPVIQRLGQRDHPDRPYSDPRVEVHLDDGRNFLRSTTRQYDLIVYALVDSLVLHSGYSNLRLESYLFTREAFADARRRLRPGGSLVLYNYFRQGWVVARLNQGLAEEFQQSPLVLAIPNRSTIDEGPSSGFTVMFAGAVGEIADAFSAHQTYQIDTERAPGPASPDGFALEPGPTVASFGLATLRPPTDLAPATDDWPFLYLRKPMLPSLSWRGMLVLGCLSLLVVYLFAPRANLRSNIDGRMFFLGAGFMLIEAKAVVQLALLFGSTWAVNSLVFLAVLAMILLANLAVLRFRPERLGLAYLALAVALVLEWAVPLRSFLGLSPSVRAAVACALVFAPILFAGIVFAISFRRSRAPSMDLGTNVVGAMLGGLAENISMWIGFRNLTLVAMALYALSAIIHRRPGPVSTDRAAGTDS